MGGKSQQPSEDPLSRLHQAHSAIAQVLKQVDDLVLKAHRLSACKQIDSSLDLCHFSRLLETTASSLQEWIPRFEDATDRACLEDEVCQDGGMPTSVQDKKGGDKEENEARKGEEFLCGQSENSSENLLDVVMLDGKENLLSDSPLVPWLDKVQFFILTPMAKRKKAFSPKLLSRSSFKEQERLQTPSRARALHTHAGIIPVNLSPSLDTCADSMRDMPASANLQSTSSLFHPDMPTSANLRSMLSFDTCTNEEESMIKEPLISVATTPSNLVHQHGVEEADSIDIATPLQSLVKRYSSFFETCEQFSDSSPLPLLIPAVNKQKQASIRGKEKEEAEEECIEITEYFTAFSPPRSLAPYMSTSERSPRSLFSVNSSPQGKEGAYIVEQGTPMPPQSLMKRYSQFLHTEEERDEMADSNMTLTPMFPGSPPKTCVLMQPNHGTGAALSFRKSIQTPLLRLKSPFRTPGLDFNKAIDHAFYEDMDLTSLKKLCQPPRPPETVRTPSSDMQFATIKKALGSKKRTPLVDLQLSTVRKPGAPLPGEQTLKRELWCRMEAEFASMADVCKSLFTDKVEAPENAKVEKAEVENRQPKGSKLAARRMQRRGSSMY